MSDESSILMLSQRGMSISLLLPCITFRNRSAFKLFSWVMHCGINGFPVCSRGNIITQDDRWFSPGVTPLENIFMLERAFPD